MKMMIAGTMNLNSATGLRRTLAQPPESSITAHGAEHELEMLIKKPTPTVTCIGADGIDDDGSAGSLHPQSTALPPPASIAAHGAVDDLAALLHGTPFPPPPLMSPPDSITAANAEDESIALLPGTPLPPPSMSRINKIKFLKEQFEKKQKAIEYLKELIELEKEENPGIKTEKQSTLEEKYKEKEGEMKRIQSIIGKLEKDINGSEETHGAVGSKGGKVELDELSGMSSPQPLYSILTTILAVWLLIQ